MFIGRWEFWPDTFMCLVLGLLLPAWGLFIFWWLPRRAAGKKRQRDLRESNLDMEFFRLHERQKHRHHMVLFPSKNPETLYWRCMGDCPILPLEIHWNREAYKEEAIKGYKRPAPHLPGWAG